MPNHRDITGIQPDRLKITFLRGNLTGSRGAQPANSGKSAAGAGAITKERLPAVRWAFLAVRWAFPVRSGEPALQGVPGRFAQPAQC